MRSPWTSAALGTLLAVMLLNQYPLWGSNNAHGTAIDFSIGYVFAAGAFFLAATILFVLGRPTDQAVAAALMAFGLFADFLLMGIITDGTTGEYLLAAALLTGLYGALFLGLHRPDQTAAA